MGPLSPPAHHVTGNDPSTAPSSLPGSDQPSLTPAGEQSLHSQHLSFDKSHQSGLRNLSRLLGVLALTMIVSRSVY